MTSLESLGSEIRAQEQRLARMRAEKDMLSAQLAKCSEKLDAEAQKARDLGDSILLVQSFSGSIQTGVIQQFEDLLTRGVRQIFGREYDIRIDFQAKGNSFWADFHALLPNGRRVSLSNGEGGGLKDLAAVLNRILYLVLDPTQPAKVVFMDENLANMDPWRFPHAFPLLVRIMRELGIQGVWVTHGDPMVLAEANTPGVSIVEVRHDGQISSCEVIKE